MGHGLPVMSLAPCHEFMTGPHTICGWSRRRLAAYCGGPCSVQGPTLIAFDRKIERENCCHEKIATFYYLLFILYVCRSDIGSCRQPRYRSMLSLRSEIQVRTIGFGDQP